MIAPHVAELVSNVGDDGVALAFFDLGSLRCLELLHREQTIAVGPGTKLGPGRTSHTSRRRWRPEKRCGRQCKNVAKPATERRKDRRQRPETLISNWLSIEALPPSIFFYDFKGGISIGAAQAAIKDCPIPIAAHNRGFLSFAPLHQLQENFGPNLPLQLADTCDTNTFLDSGWHSQRLAPKDCRPKFTDISRRALDVYFDGKGLKPFEYADRRNAWWATSRHATMDQHAFAWGDLKGRRQLVGRSEKRGFHWHYGVSCWARSGPVRHVRIAGRVIFTSNGHDLIGDARRVHRMRRTFCKGWRNDKWRDLLLAFWHWLADGAEFVDISLGEGSSMRLGLPPMTFTAPFGVNSLTDAAAPDEGDEDDDVMVDRDDDDQGDDDEGEV
jgi:hypothetical protein